MKKTVKLISLALLLVATDVFAQARINTNVIELQNRIEAQINHNAETLMATKLDPGTYKLASRVKVIEIPPQQKPKDEKPENDNEDPLDASIDEGLPAGMGLGSIDVRELIESYKREIKELKLWRRLDQQKQKPLPEPEALPTYAVSRIEVVVGLSELYDDEFVAEFQGWLTRRVQFDYGSRAVATVDKFTPVPKKEEEILPEEPVVADEGLTLKDLLPYLPYALVTLGLILAALFLGRGLRKLGEGAKRLIVENDNPLKMERTNKYEGDFAGFGHGGQGRGGKDDEQDEEWKAESEVIEMLQASKPKPEDLVEKVIYLCHDLNKKVNDLVRVWLDNGADGYLKTAILLDTIISHREFKVPGKDVEIPLDIDLSVTYEVNISEAYREASTMSRENKMEILTKVYWDLLGTKTLGLKALRKPFDFMQSMNDVNYAEALKSYEDEESKALSIIFSGEQKAKYALETSGDTEKEALVENMIKMSRVKKRKIWDLDSKAQASVLNTDGLDDDNVVNLFPRVESILNSLSAIDEARVLRKVVHNLEDQGAGLKQQYTTLAFIDEWHQEYVAKLVNVATTSELVDLIHVIPQVKESILASSTERVRMVIEDDLKVHKLDEASLAKSVRLLRSKWRNLCLAEGISMSQVISFIKKGEIKNVA